ncbi:MAG: MarR family transcriptional regulator [Fusobacteriaceae bacterium]|jgi:DNA-binding MarR family transcriptional regulator|nr:MarR family transcriptional regulator [Fusobacteriaceae bacterium]
MKYITETLGIKVADDDTPWAKEKQLQYFLTDTYEFQSATLGDVKCLFVKPKGEMAAVSAIKKHLEKVAEQAKMPLVLLPSGLNAKQRKALIAAQIPFVIDGNQLYLPFLGVALQERYVKPPQKVETLSPTTQLVLFHYLYAGKKEMYVNGLAELFGVSAMQISRAVKQLVALELIKTRKDSVQVVIIGTESDEGIFEKAKLHLLNPVRKRFYIDNEVLPSNLPISGEAALSEYTMLAPPQAPVYAYDGKVNDLPGTNTFIDGSEQSQVEIWRYSPTILSRKCGVADPLSLWASITNEEDDPRIEMAKEELLETIWRGE